MIGGSLPACYFRLLDTAKIYSILDISLMYFKTDIP